jgi:hypothetical protein
LLSLAFCVAGSWLAPRQSNEVLEIYFGERSRHGGKPRHATYDAVQ